jgi:hypothetical protein
VRARALRAGARDGCVLALHVVARAL